MMSKLRNLSWGCSKFVKNERGATAIEYGLLAAILAVGIIAGAQGIGSVVTDMWNGLSGDVSGA